MFPSILMKSINLFTAIVMILQPILAAIPAEVVRARPIDAVPQPAESAPSTMAGDAGPLTATVPLPKAASGASLATQPGFQQNPSWPPADPDFQVDSVLDAEDADLGDPACASASGECTLRAAIMQANELAGAQTIALPALPGGPYTLTITGAGEDGATTGDLDITSDLTIVGEDTATTIIDGGGLDRVFHITGEYTVSISGVTIRNGGNAGAGGGVLNWGTLTLANSMVRENVTAASPGIGGGICNYNTLTLIDSTVRQNRAYLSGGGVYTEPAYSLATTEISRSAIIANWVSTGSNGGGISSTGTASAPVVLAITNSTISENFILGSEVAPLGSGIYNGEYSTATLTNSTIYANTATGGTSGIHQANGGVVILRNTIIAANNCSPWDNSITSGGHNLESSNSCNLTDPTDLTYTNPLLGPLDDYGGPTLTRALLEDSPAIDAGSNANCPATDQRGVPRPEGGICDIGAYEYTIQPLLDTSITNIPGAPDKQSGLSGDSREQCGVSVNTEDMTPLEGDPINTRTGALDYTAVDLSFPVLGGQMVFQRFYSSLATDLHTAPLGPGWTHNQDTRLIFHDPEDPEPGSAEGEVRFKPHSGNLLIFTDNGDDTYTARVGVLAELEKLGDGSYQLIGCHNSVYTFLPDGRLDTWQSPEGYTWQYTYDAADPSLLVRIEETTSHLGLTLAYTASRLTSVTDPEGRTVSYQYNSATGDLSTVTDLRSRPWTYSYDQHRLEEVTNPLGQTVEHTVYDAEGRAIAQYDQLGWPHGAAAPVGEPVVTLDYSSYDVDGRVTITDALGNQTIAIYDKYRGVLVTLQEPTDPADNPAETKRNSDFRPTRITDENDSTTTMAWSPDRVNLTGVIDANENPTVLAYDARNHPAWVTDANQTHTLFIYNLYFAPSNLRFYI